MRAFFVSLVVAVAGLFIVLSTGSNTVSTPTSDVAEFVGVCSQVATDVEDNTLPHRPDGTQYTAESLVAQVKTEFGFDCTPFIK